MKGSDVFPGMTSTGVLPYHYEAQTYKTRRGTVYSLTSLGPRMGALPHQTENCGEMKVVGQHREYYMCHQGMGLCDVPRPNRGNIAIFLRLGLLMSNFISTFLGINTKP